MRPGESASIWASSAAACRSRGSARRRIRGRRDSGLAASCSWVAGESSLRFVVVADLWDPSRSRMPVSTSMRGRRQQGLGSDQAVRVAVVAVGEVEVVGPSAAGDGDVQELSGSSPATRVWEVSVVMPWAAWTVRGVPELDVLGDVRGGEPKGTTEPVMSRGDAVIGVDLGDGPTVAVLDPVTCREDQPAVVASGDDDVAGGCPIAVVERDLCAAVG